MTFETHNASRDVTGRGSSRWLLALVCSGLVPAGSPPTARAEPPAQSATRPPAESPDAPRVARPDSLAEPPDTLDFQPVRDGIITGLGLTFWVLRTEPIRILDLTYLFIVIGLGILNAEANKKMSVAEILAVNSAIVLATAILELRLSARSHRSTPMHYDKLELLRPGSEPELHADLGERTGLEVLRVDVHCIEMIRDAAEIVVHHIQPRR